LAQVTAAGRSNALAAKLVALTMPGVPDVYQGSELWETSLVDPDNRRPVDFDHRAAVLAGTADDDAAAKLHLTRAALTLRRDRPELFTSYTPVAASGPTAGHVLAFDRGGAITVATRLPAGLETAGGWGPTTLDMPAGDWRDILTDRPATTSLADLLATHPVALLVREDT
jgi:(1->4)-alpha-D-glucan 1-alpha-D-glucosylmutase